MEDALRILRERWAYPGFRDFQVLALEHIFAGENVLLVAPTSGGKSLAFQIPALLFDGTCLVFSPLIALMQDQAHDCERRGIPVSFINSQLTPAEVTERIEAFVAGQYKLLYVAPERLGVRAFRDALGRATVSMIAVDEAHCHPPSTPITMADGSSRRIDEVDIGDAVLSCGDDGVLRARRVLQHRRVEIGARKLLRVTTSTGALEITDDHEVYALDGGGNQVTIPAGRLRVGATVVCLAEEIHSAWRCLAEEIHSAWRDSGAEATPPAHPGAAEGAVRSSIPDSNEGVCALGSGARAEHGGRRVRWAEPHGEPEAASARSGSGFVVGYARVEGVEVLEPRDHERDGSSGRDYRLVHSLTIEEDHRYFAGGVCTRNCASRWGSDFRPDYAKLHQAGDIIEQSVGKRPLTLMTTATCTRGIEADIARSLHVDGYQRIVGDPIRPNLVYSTVRPYASPWYELKRIAEQRFRAPGRHIVYCSTRKATETVATMLGESFDKIGYYHAGIEDGRDRIQKDFKEGRLLRLAATNAFGMGIDVPDIRTVAHLGISGSIEDYVQEVGRGGRDGVEAHGILIHNDQSVDIQRMFLDGANPPTEYYALVWDFLTHAVLPGYEITASAARITEEIERTRGVKLPSRAVGTILNIMDRLGVVRRQYQKSGGMPVTVYPDKVSSFALSNPADTATRPVCNWLVEATRKAGKTQILLQPGEMGRALSLAPSALDKSRKRLKDAGAILVGRVFTGKSTRVDPKNAKARIEDLIRFDGLMAKRKLDLAKLQAMLDYAELKSLADRREYIRRYFMEDVSTPVAADAEKVVQAADMLRELRDVDVLD